MALEVHLAGILLSHMLELHLAELDFLNQNLGGMMETEGNGFRGAQEGSIHCSTTDTVLTCVLSCG